MSNIYQPSVLKKPPLSDRKRAKVHHGDETVLDSKLDIMAAKAKRLLEIFIAVISLKYMLERRENLYSINYLTIKMLKIEIELFSIYEIGGFFL